MVMPSRSALLIQGKMKLSLLSILNQEMMLSLSKTGFIILTLRRSSSLILRRPRSFVAPSLLPVSATAQVACEASVSMEFSALKSRFPYFGCARDGAGKQRKTHKWELQVGGLLVCLADLLFFKL